MQIHKRRFDKDRNLSERAGIYDGLRFFPFAAGKKVLFLRGRICYTDFINNRVRWKEKERHMKLYVLHAGYIRVSREVPFGDRTDLKTVGKMLAAPDRERVTLPVCCYLLEHPRGPVLIDTGWGREISPNGVYDPAAVSRCLPQRLAAFYRPWVPAGMTVREQLIARGLGPEDLKCIVLTHLDPDHVAGLHSLRGAQRVVLPEDEYFWSCRTVFKLRQPRSLWIDEPIERLYYRGSPLGPNRWAIDLFGDESVQLINVPGHTDGQAAVLIRNGARFVLLAADAAFSPRNWEEEITPGFGFGRDWQLRSLRWLGSMAADPNCAAVLCSHDADVQAGTIEF